MRDREFERAVERAVQRALNPGIGCQGCGCLLLVGLFIFSVGIALLGDLFLKLEGKDRERAPAYQAFRADPPELRFRQVRVTFDEVTCGPRELGKGENRLTLKEGRFCLIKLTVRNAGTEQATVMSLGVAGTEAAGTHLWGRGLSDYPGIARAGGCDRWRAMRSCPRARPGSTPSGSWSRRTKIRTV